MKTIVCCGCDRSVNLTEWYPPRLTEGWLYDRDSKLWVCPSCAADDDAIERDVDDAIERSAS